MQDKRKLISELLISISGVLLFVSLNYWVDLNGFNQYSPLIALTGVLILIWPDYLLKLLGRIKVSFLSKQILLSISHILVFVGIKDYLIKYLAEYHWLFVIIGIILLNHHKDIAHLITKKNKNIIND